MSVSPLPQTGRSLAGSRFARRLMQAAVSVFAAVLGLSVGPALVFLTDRATTLRWANYILDLVGR